MHLARDALDKEVVDCNGHKVGKVDDLALEFRDGRPPVVKAILGGNGTLAKRLPWPIGPLVAWGRKHVLGIEDEPDAEGIGWEHVTQIDVVVRIDLDRKKTNLLTTEDAVWKRWISKLPWAER